MAFHLFFYQVANISVLYLACLENNQTFTVEISLVVF